MIVFKISEFKREFPDNDACLEWLKNRLYPNGIECPVCRKVTKHTKVLNRHCYACTSCNNQIFPTRGTIFYKSATPLKTWFEIIRKMYRSRGLLSAKKIQREYGMTYKTAWRIVNKVQWFLMETKSVSTIIMKGGESSIINIKLKNIGRKYTKNKTAQYTDSDTSDSQVNKQISSIEPNQKWSTKYHEQKLDRTARLLRLQMLLCQKPRGLYIKEMSSKLSISERTIYRDLKTLEIELKIPVWGEGSKRGINEGYFLPPISFTLDEAHNIFGAARMLQNFYPESVPIAALTFFKLNAIAPPFYKKHIGSVLDHMEKQPRDNNLLSNYDKFKFAWTTQHKIRIIYKDNIDDEDAVEHIIEPYFVDPSIIDRVIHIIGYSNINKAISSFRFDHIIGDIIVEQETFQIPDKLDIIDFLDTAWGIRFDPEIIVAKLRFKPKVSYFALKLYLHSSQRVEVQGDGSVIMTLKIRDTLNFRNRIIEWGDIVEVLEPQKLRNQIYDLGRSLVNIYTP